MVVRWWAGAFSLVALWVLADGSPAAAQDRAGFYAGLRLVGAYSKIEDITAAGFNGPLQENNSSDLVGGGGGVVGYRWGRLPVRTEVELSHRVRFDWDFRDTGSPNVGYENNLDTTNVLFNILFEYRNMSTFTPFLGGSFGWSRNHSSVERTNINNLATVSRDNTVNSLAWGVMLGVDWAFAEHWSAEAAYRYINLGEAATGRFSTGEDITADAVVSHDVILSAMYKW